MCSLPPYQHHSQEWYGFFTKGGSALTRDHPEPITYLRVTLCGVHSVRSNRSTTGPRWYPTVLCPPGPPHPSPGSRCPLYCGSAEGSPSPRCHSRTCAIWTFSHGLLSFSDMPLRPRHALGWLGASCLPLSNIPLSGYTVYLPSPTEGHLGWCSVLAVMSKAALNI